MENVLNIAPGEGEIKDSEITIGNEKWTVKYLPQVFHPKTGTYYRAARIPDRKEIWLSLQDEEGNKFKMEDIVLYFQKAILPMVLEDLNAKYGKEKVDAAVQRAAQGM